MIMHLLHIGHCPTQAISAPRRRAQTSCALLDNNDDDTTPGVV